MFKNRDVTVKFTKKDTDDKDVADKPVDAVPLDDKIRKVVKVMRGPAAAAFGAVCVYVLMDTFRQVAVANANNPTQEID